MSNKTSNGPIGSIATFRESLYDATRQVEVDLRFSLAYTLFDECRRSYRARISAAMEESLLAQRRTALTKRWTDAVLNTYPEDAASFMRRQKDPFANPGGHLVRECIPVLLDALESGVERDKIQAPLEALLKLRALQDFTPSEAVQFLFSVKTMLHEELDFEPGASEWNTLDTRVDALVLIAFDLYMQCREKVYEVRYNQIKKINHVMLERANRGEMPRTGKLRKTEPDDRGDEG